MGEHPPDPPPRGRCRLIADFFQNGDITTLHRLGNNGTHDLERQLLHHSRHRPVALVIPCLFDELRRPALRRIVDTVADLPYIRHVVIALGKADQRQFEYAKQFFAPLKRNGRHVRVLWNEGPRLKQVYRVLDDHGIPSTRNGKGRATWATYGYLLADGEPRVIVQHDADILHYRRDLVARLAYPVVDPDSGLQYSKGYYARVSDRMHGRVTRLFVTPLVRVLRERLDNPSFLRQLDTYRYALSGEFAMDAELARRIRVPVDWGLEVGTLAQIHHHLDPQEIAQVDIADTYDHKHKELSKDDPDDGLQKMAVEVALSLLVTLHRQGIPLDGDTLSLIERDYPTTALEFVHRYRLDARLNGLVYDKHAEAEAVEVFSRSLSKALGRFKEKQRSVTWMPSWQTIHEELPSFPQMFYEAVDRDNQEKRPVRTRPMIRR